MDAFADALADAGGPLAPRGRIAQLRRLLEAELVRSEAELAAKRSGYDVPVTVVMAATHEDLFAAIPVPASLRADPEAVTERAWRVTAAAMGAMVQGATIPPPEDAAGLVVTAGELGSHLVLRLPLLPGEEPEDVSTFAAAVFDEDVRAIDRLRARALAAPVALLEDVREFRPPVGNTHPLRVAEAIARFDGLPADPASAAEHEDRVLVLLGGERGASRPHDDPDPARRVARRILQRLDGMGKWGGYHTEFVHLARGFAGNERKLAEAVGEALLEDGLLAEKPSVGQRHVFLNPRRAADVRKLIETGEEPPGLRLPPS